MPWMAASLSVPAPSEIVHWSGSRGLTMRQPSVVECSVPVAGRVGLLALEQDVRGARHRLDAADKHARGVARLDHPARLHGGVERRAAEAIDGGAGDTRRQA